MFYVYSTATCDIKYVTYVDNSPHDLGRPALSASGKPLIVLIKGGTGVANKHFVTPRGVITQVTDDEMGQLLDNVRFKKHLERGFMSYEKKEQNIDHMIKNMEKKDKSAPITAEDFVDGDNSDVNEKVYKSKNSKRK